MHNVYSRHLFTMESDNFMDKQTAKTLQIANQRLQARQYTAAAEIAGTILHNHPNNLQAHQIAGLALHHSGQHQEALHHYNAVVTISRGHPSALTTRSAIALAAGKPTLARTDARKAVQLAPASFTGWMNLGLACAHLNHWKEAEAAFSQAQKLSPDSTHPQIERAISQLHLARQTPPEIPQPRHIKDYRDEQSNWLKLLTQLSLHAPQACQDFSLAVWQLLIETEAYQHALHWAQQHQQLGLFRSADQFAEQLCHQAPADIVRQALLMRASIALARGTPDIAIKRYKQLLKHSPDFWQAHSNYLIALQHDPKLTQNDIDQAHKAWEPESTPRPSHRLTPYPPVATPRNPDAFSG